MRAIAIEEFGGPEKLRPMALPRPRPGRGEVLIRVVAAGVSPMDCRMRRGELREAFPHRFPIVPGWDVAGVIEEFGEGASRHRKGDRVWACAIQSTIQWGCYAEYVAVPETSLALMPGQLLFEEAASVPLAALTAYQCLGGRSGVKEGATVLIHAAGGGVGHFAVQLARLAGARVFGTGSGASHSFILGLGAAAAIDYTTEDFRDALRRHAPDGADLVIDTVGGQTLADSYAALKTGGRLVSIVDRPDTDEAARLGLRVSALRVEPDGDQLAEIGRLFDQKKLTTHVQKIYGLAQAADAHKAVEEGHVKGKLVLNI